MAEYIERETMIQAIREYKGFFQDSPSTNHMILKMEAEDVARDLEAADVAPVVHSRWEQCDYIEPCIHGFGTNRIKNAGMKCINCVHVFKKDLLWTSKFCPNCGAKMDLED